MVVITVHGSSRRVSLLDGQIMGWHGVRHTISRSFRYALPEYILERHRLNEPRAKLRMLSRDEMYNRLLPALADNYFAMRDVDGYAYNAFLIDPYLSRTYDGEKQAGEHTARDIFTVVPTHFRASPLNYRRLLVSYPVDLAEGEECTAFLADTLLIPSEWRHFAHALGRDLQYFVAVAETELKRVADLEGESTLQTALQERNLTFRRVR